MGLTPWPDGLPRHKHISAICQAEEMGVYCWVEGPVYTGLVWRGWERHIWPHIQALKFLYPEGWAPHPGLGGGCSRSHLCLHQLPGRSLSILPGPTITYPLTEPA